MKKMILCRERLANDLVLFRRKPQIASLKSKSKALQEHKKCMLIFRYIHYYYTFIFTLTEIDWID